MKLPWNLLIVLWAWLVGSSSVASPACQTKIELNQGWTLQNSTYIPASGLSVSQPGYLLKEGISALVPGTVLGSLLQNLKFDPFFAKNLNRLPGTVFEYKEGINYSKIETPASSPFASPWWYRTEFTIPSSVHQNCGLDFVDLNFLGITYGAQIWLNGVQIANVASTLGSYRTHRFDISKLLHPGGAANALAVLVYPPHPQDLTATWVDWNPTPQDKNMGIWRKVFLSIHRAVSIKDTFVSAQLRPVRPVIPAKSIAGSSADLQVETDLVNDSDVAISGDLKLKIEKNGLKKNVTVPAHSRLTVILRAEEFPQLHLVNPKLWWPRSMGSPHLYHGRISFESQGQNHDEQNLDFGIRQVDSKLTAEGARIYLINGLPLQIRGAGWASDLFLRHQKHRLEAELQYVLDLGLNTIRLEGQFQDPEFYELTDQMGILVMPGLACCGAWQQRFPPEPLAEDDVVWTEAQYPIAEASLMSEARLMRGHPSVFVFLYGSDKAPPLRTELMYQNIFTEAQWPNPLLSNASHYQTALNGPSGVKMNGPYDYTPPSYWYLDKPEGPCATSPQKECGGAWSFNTETSPGASIPPIESLKKFIPAEHLWPIDDFWNFHSGQNGFHNLDNFVQGVARRYGPSLTLEDFVKKAELAGYDNHRAMFESFLKNKYKSATGLIQWMLNNAWPSLIWHLYDYELQPGSAYFGVKKANEALHILYALDDRSVVVINNTLLEKRNLTAQIRVFDLLGNSLFEKELKTSLAKDSVQNLGSLPEIHVESDHKVYFIDLKLLEMDGTKISSNFYWLSTQPEIYDWEKTDFYHTPLRQEGDFHELSNLGSTQVKIQAWWNSSIRSGHVLVKNLGRLPAFFLRLSWTQGPANEQILPILWSDNYFTLLPSEEREISFSSLNAEDPIERPLLHIQGWNIQESDIQPTE